MLVLSRKLGESILIGNNITVEVRRVSKSHVAISIDAPQDVRIMRSEVIAQRVTELQGVEPKGTSSSQ